MNNYKRSAAGYRSRLAGQTFENIVDAACDYYRKTGAAEIEKTPEPFKVERPAGNGKFYGHFEHRAQPDYKGTLKGGYAVVFEAKHTDSGKMEQRRVTEDQAARLEAHLALGAAAFVLLSFGLRYYYAVPWTVWREIPEHYGRKYVTPEDLKEYEVKIKGGVLRFLDWWERKETE